MTYVITANAAAQYAALPAALKAKFNKQLGFLLSDLRPPAPFPPGQKYDEAAHRWQARIDRSWRFFFRIEGDTYNILAIIPHPK